LNIILILFHIGARFCHTKNISIKGRRVSEPRVKIFNDIKKILELKNWRIGGRPSQLIVSPPIYVMNPSFELVVYVLAMSNKFHCG